MQCQMLVCKSCSTAAHGGPWLCQTCSPSIDSATAVQDACIVLEDADIELAAKNIIKGGFSYSGQRCTAVKVVLAIESIADKLVEKVSKGVDGLSVGRPEVSNLSCWTCCVACFMLYVNDNMLLYVIIVIRSRLHLVRADQHICLPYHALLPALHCFMSLSAPVNCLLCHCWQP